MHPTRQQILNYLKRYGQATITELAEHLNMAPVSARHHLDLLIADNLVATSSVRKQTGAGRPKRLYALTDQADALFPNGYQRLANESLAILKQTLPPQQFSEVLAELARQTAARAHLPAAQRPLAERVQAAVDFLNQEGYMAFCECGPDEIILHTSHCPYKELLSRHPEICHIDQILLQELTGMTPTRFAHISQGEPRCSYRFKS